MILLLLLIARPTPARDPRPGNPHGRPDACLQCHSDAARGTRPEAMTWSTGHPDATCRACHDDDPHQVGLLPDRTRPQEGMLLYEERLACFSCHDEPACDGRSVDPLDPDFFRGGPYDSQGELCARCHQVSGQDRFDPHGAMARGERGEVCEHCHLETPEPDAGEADLKIAGPNICLGCHPENVHVGSRAHLAPLDGAMARSAEAAGLPLHEDRRVVCVTCHDPHPSSLKASARERARREGLPLYPDSWWAQVVEPAFEERAEALGARLEPVRVESDYLRLSAADGALCMACHDAQGIEALRRARR